MSVKKLAVFGNPIAHSLSPQLHAEFARNCDITIDYQKIFVPIGEFTKTVDAFRATGGIGANITAPFKFEAYDYCDEHTDRAKRTRTVNTFIFKNNICIGDNTDGAGFIADLTTKQFNCFGKNILILGAGGATQGILGELISQKTNNIFIANRTIEKTNNIIDFFSTRLAGARASLQHFSHSEKNGREVGAIATTSSIDLLVNATSMNFQTDCALQLDLSNTICYDLNYGERHNTFSDWAKKNNACVIYDGMGMLIEQGAESFLQWFDALVSTRASIASNEKGELSNLILY